MRDAVSTPVYGAAAEGGAARRLQMTNDSFRRPASSSAVRQTGESRLRNASSSEPGPDINVHVDEITPDGEERPLNGESKLAFYTTKLRPG